MWSLLQAGAVLIIAAPALAQQSGWIEHQVNATMCHWEQPRAAVLRDMLYIDGGTIWWKPGMVDGSYADIRNDDNRLGLVFTLNFSRPFSTTENISSLLVTLSKPGSGGATNTAPTYLDGAMLGNDAEWFLYGGVTAKTNAFKPQDRDATYEYQAYSFGPPKPAFVPGFQSNRLTEGVTRYLAYGGSASAPSENKAWYFSGMHSASFGEFFEVGAGEPATNVSKTLITLDMASQNFEKWSNDTLTGGVQGRANPELVWVPVGQQGILVAIGGVVHPDFVTIGGSSDNPAASKSESPKFMSTVDIYDVANKTWYQQGTTGGPTTGLARGCTVVAPAQDNSSFNIYWYGGYEALDTADPYSDDVWVLSLPSFVWKQVYKGNADQHGRAGHKCFLPYPDQMMVVGGYRSRTDNRCVGGSIIQVFNLTSGTWQASYDPAKWSKYKVPEELYNTIGGSETGGATMTTPTPSGWSSPELAKVFASPYPVTKITTYYPYASVGPEKNATNPDVPQKDNGSGVPKFLPPLLGVICGLMLITAIAVGILLYRRRQLLRRTGRSEGGSEDAGNRILSWIRGQPTEKAATLTTSDDAPHTPPMSMSTTEGRPTLSSEPSELPDSHIAEMGDTSTPLPTELQDTGLSPAEIVQRHSHFAPGHHLATGGASSLNDPSQYSTVTQTDHASTISRSTGPRPAFGLSDPRPDSPALGAAGAGPADRGGSGVSVVSEGDRTHLRQISDTTVDSVALRGGGQSLPVSPEPAQSTIVPMTPGISPPSPAGEADDYLSARRITETSMGSATQAREIPRRKSAFLEHDDVTGLNK